MQQIVLGAMGLTCATCGAVTACLANRLPMYTAALQIIAGLLLLGGFALLGSAMPHIEWF
jgi:hypothetical protein